MKTCNFRGPFDCPRFKVGVSALGNREEDSREYKYDAFWGLGLRVQGVGFGAYGLGLRIQGECCRVWSSRLSFQGVGFGSRALGSRL